MGKFGKIVKWGGIKYGKKEMEWEDWRETICERVGKKIGTEKIESKLNLEKENGKILGKLEVWEMSKIGNGKISGKLEVWKFGK